MIHESITAVSNLPILMYEIQLAAGSRQLVPNGDLQPVGKRWTVRIRACHVVQAMAYVRSEWPLAVAVSINTVAGDGLRAAG